MQPSRVRSAHRNVLSNLQTRFATSDMASVEPSDNTTRIPVCEAHPTVVRCRTRAMKPRRAGFAGRIRLCTRQFDVSWEPRLQRGTRKPAEAETPAAGTAGPTRLHVLARPGQPKPQLRKQPLAEPVPHRSTLIASGTRRSNEFHRHDDLLCFTSRIQSHDPATSMGPHCGCAWFSGGGKRGWISRRTCSCASANVATTTAPQPMRSFGLSRSPCASHNPTTSVSPGNRPRRCLHR